MEALLNRFKESLHRILEAPQSHTFLLGVSGGVDSMVLLYFFKSLGLNFAVAHVNYQLRDEDSDLDEALVRQTCESFGISCFTKVVDPLEQKSLQTWAREIRYNWYQECMETHMIDFLVLAHHQNDQVETFFINALRGSGVNGLKGMLPRSGEVIRPLLSFQKEELRVFASDGNIPFREDISNASDNYLRNRIRNHLIPFLEEENPDVISRIAYNQETLGKQWKEILFQMKWVAEENQLDTGYEDVKGYAIPGILSNVCFVENWLQVISPVGIHTDDLEKIKKSMYEGSSESKQYEWGEHVIEVKRDAIYFYEKIPPFQFRIVQDLAELKSMEEYTVSVVEKQELDDNFEQGMGYFDLDKIKFPITIKSAKEGDTMIPLGMKGAKRISDIFTDKKTAAWQKQMTKIWENAEGIFWLEKMVSSDPTKCTSDTKNVLCVKKVGNPMAKH